MKKLTTRRPGDRLITFWATEGLITAIDEGVRAEDLDRAKYVRRAIREKLARHGIIIENGGTKKGE